jgi:hypothetical protein
MFAIILICVRSQILNPLTCRFWNWLFHP